MKFETGAFLCNCEKKNGTHGTQIQVQKIVIVKENYFLLAPMGVEKVIMGIVLSF